MTVTHTVPKNVMETGSDARISSHSHKPLNACDTEIKRIIFLKKRQRHGSRAQARD